MHMHALVKAIFTKDISFEKKKKEISEIKKSIELAERIFSGELKYCQECDDFYFSKSFFVEQEIVEEDICTYRDIINSGGNEYEKRNVSYTYKCCPKGHREVISRKVH